MVGFLIEYGNDFFSIPIALAPGPLVSIENLTVTNPFGDGTSAVQFADEDWRLFTYPTMSGPVRPGRTAPG
jgi:hypothetical protein